MKYFLIAGEPSGDLHASHLMKSLQDIDPQAQFRFYGGDLMAKASSNALMLQHYSQMAYMGFVPVLLHLPVILRFMRRCKADIREWQPDVVILIDYPGFNLDIAAYVHRHHIAPVYYYISPKIWAWKEHRIKNIKRDVDQLFSILPFEVDFYQHKHHYPIHYVGNPTVDEVRQFKSAYHETFLQFASRNHLQADQPVIALLPGSRRQEIKDNLPAMLQAVKTFAHCQPVVACVPSIGEDFYREVWGNDAPNHVTDETYALLSHAQVAIVTSGTATLETSLIGVPQVVCYKTPVPRLIAFLRRHLLKVPYISLVNLIAGREVVRELVADSFSVGNIRTETQLLLPGGKGREAQLKGYEEVCRWLGSENAPENAAKTMVAMLRKQGK